MDFSVWTNCRLRSNCYNTLLIRIENKTRTGGIVLQFLPLDGEDLVNDVHDLRICFRLENIHIGTVAKAKFYRVHVPH